MNRSKLWGFEVSQIMTAFMVLAGSNVTLSMFGAPLIFSWLLGVVALIGLRVLSLGQKNGHLELLVRFTVEPHLFLGHRERRKAHAEKILTH